MQTVKNIGIGLLCAPLIIPFIAAAQTDNFCNTTGPMGYNVTVSLSTFAVGQPVEFCLADNTRVPLFFGPSHPWIITDAHGNAVYVPPTVPLTTQPPATFSFIDTWDQTDLNGEQVTPGTYTVVFPGLPGSPSATFIITCMHGGMMHGNGMMQSQADAHRSLRSCEAHIVHMHMGMHDISMHEH